VSYAGPKDLNREAELNTLPVVGSTVPVGRVTFFNEALRQFLKTFNDKSLPSVVTKRWLAIRQIFTVTASASEPDQPGKFARQHFTRIMVPPHTGHFNASPFMGVKNRTYHAAPCRNRCAFERTHVQSLNGTNTELWVCK